MSNVKITGIGTINSVARNISEFREALYNMKCGIKFFPDLNLYMAPLKEFDFESCINQYSQLYPEKYALTRKIFHRETKELKACITAVWEAVSASGVLNIKNRRRVSVIVAGSNLSQSLSYNTYKKYCDRADFTNPRYAIQYMDTYVMSLISEIFEICGEGFTVGGASASGNVAIVKAKQLIDLDLADACVVVGLPTSLSPIELMAFENLNTFGGKTKQSLPEMVCRPFDSMHDGFVPAQSASCIVIEKSGIENGSDGLAEICSAVSFVDGNSGSAPSHEGEIETMKYAVNKAGIEISEIDYINSHGTSTPLGDITELSAIESVFGNYPKINSSKSIIGHCLNCAGIIEAIAVVLQIREGFIHGNRNLVSPVNKNVMLAGNTTDGAVVNYALSNSFGFGGINSSIIIKKV